MSEAETNDFPQPRFDSPPESPEDSAGDRADMVPPGRLLTPEERQELEQEGVFILEDTPDILYCCSETGVHTGRNIGKILNENKPFLWIAGVRDIADKEKLPTLDEVIGMVLQRKGMIENLLKDPLNEDIVLKRDAIDKKNIGEINDPQTLKLVGTLQHSNSYGFVEAFPPEGQTRDYEYIKFLGSDTLRRQYMEGFMLEACAMEFFEPNFRSRSVARKYDLNPENPREILDDDKVGVFNQMVDDFISNDKFDPVAITVKEYFGNDKERFRQRLTEFYDNWWPKEFQTMKGGIDKIKSWLRTIKGSNATEI
ncbi:MAG: hypothetical protein WC495_05335 [Patescibacteria group bacterium]